MSNIRFEITSPDDTVTYYVSNRVSDFLVQCVEDYVPEDENDIPIVPISCIYENGVRLYTDMYREESGTIGEWIVSEIIDLILFADYIQDLYAPGMDEVVRLLAIAIVQKYDVEFDPFIGIEITPTIIDRIHEHDVKAIILAIALGRINPGWIHTLEDPTFINKLDVFGYQYTYPLIAENCPPHGIFTQDQLELFTSLETLKIAPFNVRRLNLCTDTLKYLTIDGNPHGDASSSKIQIQLMPEMLNNLHTLKCYFGPTTVYRPADSACQLRQVDGSVQLIDAIFNPDEVYPSIETLNYLPINSGNCFTYIPRHSPIRRFPNLKNLTITDGPYSRIFARQLSTLIGSSVRNITMLLPSNDNVIRTVSLRYNSPITQSDIDKLISMPSCEPIEELYALSLTNGIFEFTIDPCQYFAIAPNIKAFKSNCARCSSDFKFPATLTHLAIHPLAATPLNCSLLTNLKTFEICGKVLTYARFNKQYPFAASVETIIDSLDMLSPGIVYFMNFTKLKRVERPHVDIHRKNIVLVGSSYDNLEINHSIHVRR